jgi:hypothetical protein
MAFHDLTTRMKPPNNVRSLLGLNLKFVPNPTRNIPWATFDKVILPRFDRYLRVKVFMEGVEEDPENPYNPKMYALSDWIPPNLFTPLDIRERLSAFKTALKTQYKPHRCRSNLMKHQQRSLNLLRNQDNFIIVQCDKNLGPEIIKKDEYIKLDLLHLQDTTTYRRLIRLEDTICSGQIRQTIKSWASHHSNYLTKNESQYLRRSLASNVNPSGAFCLLMKVHKDPPSTRSIMSASGSLLFALGVWTENKLQPFAKRQKAYLNSSQILKLQLDDFVVPPNSYLFTADTVSMYTNIPTDRSITLICNHIRATAHLLPTVPVESLCATLHIVMRCNIFSFGGTFWRQISGTAMGFPTAPPWANTFYALCEASVLPIYQENLALYRRFINDVKGIWTITNPDSNDATWEAFKAAMNNPAFTLEWIVSPGSHVVDFMDLTLSIQQDRIITTLYEKPSNFHLYIPPHSCHPPPGLLRGMV